MRDVMKRLAMFGIVVALAFPGAAAAGPKEDALATVNKFLDVLTRGSWTRWSACSLPTR
jgi:hypothetical protein